MAELSDYTIEALELFKRKLTTYIEAVDKSLVSAAEESLNFDFHEKLPSGTY
ncbi:unnamed protein product [Schistosoma spindalis]|nr:unnamed protein product [Schistosoma spindale]